MAKHPHPKMTEEPVEALEEAPVPAPEPEAPAEEFISEATKAEMATGAAALDKWKSERPDE